MGLLLGFRRFTSAEHLALRAGRRGTRTTPPEACPRLRGSWGGARLPHAEYRGPKCPNSTFTAVGPRTELGLGTGHRGSGLYPSPAVGLPEGQSLSPSLDLSMLRCVDIPGPACWWAGPWRWGGAAAGRGPWRRGGASGGRCIRLAPPPAPTTPSRGSVTVRVDSARSTRYGAVPEGEAALPGTHRASSLGPTPPFPYSRGTTGSRDSP